MAWKNGAITPMGEAEKIPGEVSKKYFYVSEDGSDLNDGSFEKPFATLTAAKNAVRQYKEVKGIPKDGISVLFRGGTYRVTNSAEFTDADSGTPESPITYEAYQNESVIFTGGVEIPGNAFKKAENDSVADRIPQNAKGKVYCVNLRDYGIYDYDTGYDKGYSNLEFPDMGVYFNGEPMITARYPNVGQNGERHYLLAEEIGEQNISFKYSDGFFESVKDFKGAVIEGWLRNGYYYEAFGINNVDRENDTVTLGRGKMSKNARYIINNIPEALDSSGEYYLDKETGMLYLIPSDDNIGKSKISVAAFGKDISEAPIKTNGASYICFRGFTISDCASGGIYIYGGRSISIDRCTVKNIGYTGIIVGDYRRNNMYQTVAGVNPNAYDKFFDSDYTRAYNHSITNTSVYNAGEGGIKLYGGNRLKLEPAGFRISGCTLHDCGMYKYNEPIVKAVGVGIEISGNTIYNSPAAGIGFAGNDIIIEKNELYNLAAEVDDFGMIYSSSTVGAEIQAGSEIRYNYFHDVPGKIENTEPAVKENYYVHRPAVYHDFSGAFLNVHHNFFENIPIGIYNSGGAENNWNDNVFVNVDKPLLVQYNHVLREAINDGDTPDKMFKCVSTQEFSMLNTEEGVWEKKYPNVSRVKKRMTELGREAIYPNSDIKNNVAFFLTESSRASLAELSDMPSENDDNDTLKKKYLDKVTVLQHFPDLEQNKFLRQRGIDTNIFTDRETDTENIEGILADKGIILSKIGVR